QILIARVGIGVRVGLGGGLLRAGGIVNDRMVEAQQQARAVRKRLQARGDDVGRLADDLFATLPAVRATDAGPEQPQVIVNLGGGADGRAGIADAVLLTDGDGRRNAVDTVDVRLLHALEELARVGRQRLDVPPLPLGVD